MQKYNSLLTAAFLGITAVSLGAFGAHKLKPELLSRGMLEVWETAVLYHLVHTLAVFTAGLAAASARLSETLTRSLQRASLCWTAGVLLFSGSLYALSLGGPKALGPVTPLGGVLLILGWVFVAVGAFGKNDSGKDALS
jgi:uncharacterized membrane protein YgdD (TMEM256/DUF423 family)